LNKEAAASTSDNPAFRNWLAKHKMVESEFFACVAGERSPRPYFPFVTTDLYPAKILAMDVSSGPKGVAAGILSILKVICHSQGMFFATIFESHVNNDQLLKTIRFPTEVDEKGCVTIDLKCSVHCTFADTT
jgi:hypothetical protein